MDAHPAHSPRPAPPDGRAPFRDPKSGPFLRHLHAILSAWQALCFWVQVNISSPRRLLARWGRPLAGYLLALLIEVVAVGLTFLLAALVPDYSLEGVLLLVGITLVALTCGVGPSVLATGVGFLLLADVVLPASLSWQHDPTAWVDLVVFLVSGLGLGLLAGQSNWARRKAEALAGALGTAKASSEVERQRLRTLLEVLPVPITMVDTQGRFLEHPPANQTLWGDSASWARELAEVPAYPAWRPDTGQPVARDELPLVRALTTGESTFSEELEFEAVDGQRKVLLNSATPIRDERGARHGAVGVLQDITERKRLEAALRQAERETAAHAAQLETIFESIADGVTVTDPQGRVLHMNQADRAFLGLEIEQDPTGWTLPELERLAGFASYTPGGQRIIEGEDSIPRVLQGEVLTNEQSVDSILRTREGREIRRNSTGAPIRDATGQLLGPVFVTRDVTEHRRLEQQTREALDALLAMAQALVQGHTPAEQRMQPLDQAPRPGADPALAGVAARLAELTRRVLDCRSVSMVAIDAQTEALTPLTVVGHSREDEQRWWAGWEGEGQQSHLHLDDVLPPTAVAALQAGELVLPGHFPGPGRRGRQASPMRPSILVPMHVGEALVGLLQVDAGDGRNERNGGTPGEANATEQREALLRAVARLGALVLERERLLRERTQAQAIELALRRTQVHMEAFLATAAHDLRAPLTAVVGFLDLAQRQTERLAAVVQEAHPELAPRADAVGARLHDAAEGAERLTRLLALLFDTAALRAGKLELHRAPLDLVALVRAQVEALRVAAPARIIRVHPPVAASESIVVEADADRIGQVVTNYVTNSLKYSPPAQPVDVGVELSTEVSAGVPVALGGGWARVTVRDRGPGIPKEERGRVWEPFHPAPGAAGQGKTHSGTPGPGQGGSLGLG